MKLTKYALKLMLVICSIATTLAAEDDNTKAPKEATDFTKEYNKEFAGKHSLDFNDRQDFEDVNRGFIASLKDPLIKNKEGKVVYETTAFDFVKDKESPDTVNPSLWRVTQLNARNGLFKVTDTEFIRFVVLTSRI